MNVNEDMFQSTTFKSIQCITLHFKYIVSEKNHIKTLSFVALFYLFSEKKLSEIKLVIIILLLLIVIITLIMEDIYSESESKWPSRYLFLAFLPQKAVLFL